MCCKLIPKYKTKIPLMVRFVDDVFGIALVGGDDGLSEDDWSQFKNDIDDFGILTWDVEDPSKSTNFLDLTIEIKDGAFITRTYQKPISLFQYLTPHSAHPPWIIKAMIHGLLRKYYYQNTNREDYWKIAMQLYKRLKARNWDQATLKPIFVAAHEKITFQQKQKAQPQPQPLLEAESVSNTEEQF